MSFKKYFNEAVTKEQAHDKLRVRYIKASNKLEKARDIIYKVKEEMEKIQKVMKKKGIDEIVSPQGSTILDVDEEINIWDRMA